MKIYWDKNRKNVVGENVRLLRKKLDPPVNQRQLAVALQLLGYEFDRATISRIETGSRFVSDVEVMALARVLDVPIEELYRGVEEDEAHGK